MRFICETQLLDMGYPHQSDIIEHPPASFQLTASCQFRVARRSNELGELSLFLFCSLCCNMFERCMVVFCLLTVMSPRGIHCGDVNITDVSEQTENALAKLVKMFSKPGAFKQVSPEMSKVQISFKLK